MRNLLVILSLLLAGFRLSAQDSASVLVKDLPSIVIGREETLHIVSPEPIRYVDISTHAISGDLPVSNVLRLKVIPDSAAYLDQGGSTLTIIGESFIAQYRLVYLPWASVSAQVSILPGHTRPLDIPGVGLTTPELRQHALSLLTMRKGAPIRKADDYGIRATLNRVYTIGDLVLLDVTYRNQTNLSYDIDELRFKIEDRKITKASNVQSIEIKPVWQLYPTGSFKKNYRNIYVLKKATFPANKVLNVELTEKQISGRTITLKIKYRDILNADTF